MESLKRRSFLKGALATTGLILANPFIGKGSILEQSEPGQSLVPAEPMKTSIMCYSFISLLTKKEMDVFGFLESCKFRYDVQACELWDGILTSTDDAYIKRVKWGLDERDLKCSSLAWDPASIWTAKEEGREKSYKAALQALNIGKSLDAKLVRIDAGGGFQDKEWSNEAFDYIVKKYKEYCQFAQDNGFMVGPEVHWGPEVYFPNMKKLFEAVDHPAFGLLLMTDKYKGNAEERAAYDKESAKWAVATHITWETIAGGLLEERMGYLRDAGYKGYYGVEYHLGVNPYARVAVMVSSVKEVLDRWRSPESQKPKS